MGPRRCNRLLGTPRPRLILPSQLAMLLPPGMLRRFIQPQPTVPHPRQPLVRPGALRHVKPLQTGTNGGSPLPVPATLGGRDGASVLLRLDLKDWRADTELGY